MPKHIIITGASRGIGYSTAQILSNNGCYVTAVARTGDKLRALKKLDPERIFILTMDITSAEASEKIHQHLDDNGLFIDGMIHNAGLLINKPFSELTDEDWNKQIKINLMAPVRLTRELLNRFSRGSHILNLSSMGGFQGSSKFPGLSAYSVTKGALSILTECLAAELTENNISINCLCLGAVQTEMLNQAFPGIEAPVKPGEMGRYIADFILTGHQFYNGKILPVALNDPG